MNRLRALWSSLQASFWLVPTAIAVLSAAAGVALVEFDNWDRGQLAQWSPRLFGAGPDGSRAMLSAIASATITVAGVVFSITTLTLAQTATQYSPSVLRNFMRDRPTQASLGIFLGVFVYCIVVLRTVRGGDEQTYVPSMAVLGGIAYALAGIGTLIYFIHHVAQSIQVSSILRRITRDTEVAIRRWPASAPRPQELPVDALPGSWTAVPSAASGYITLVDTAGLADIAAAKTGSCASRRNWAASFRKAPHSSPSAAPRRFRKRSSGWRATPFCWRRSARRIRTRASGCSNWWTLRCAPFPAA